MNKRAISISVVLLSIIFLLAGCEDEEAYPQKRSGERGSQASGARLSSIVVDSAAEQPPTVDSGQVQRVQSQKPQNTNPQINNSRRNAITRAVRKVSPAVVSITVTEMVKGGRRLAFDEYMNRFFSVPIEREVSSMGSGFIINRDGWVVTNQHVANENAKKVVVSMTDGSQYEAKVLGSDELADLSLLKIKADRKFPFAEFGNSDSVLVGEWSLAVGNPFGLFEAAQPSVTVGVVSALHRDFRPNPNEPRVYIDMIQTDASINRGNSGGPLVDSNGKVIGVNTFIFTGGTSAGNVGLGFAIPSNRVQKIIRQLATTGEVHLSYDPGFSTIEMTYQLAAKYGLPARMGLLVNNVNRDGPAFEAGIVPGDIIIKIGNERVQSKMHGQALFREYEEGDSMRVELLRDQKRYETKMYLRKKVKE
ncbi:S1C family serine protease [Fodinibius halophilus]|uniref:Trypsin-like serine protease n=1 Tax=Fodinibius halophilus TaxID=1736908 RepID=A0A6M1T3I0_9BACT|nr:trypsin-like peptidase domain-containing protein [Fodinibius halophilus]NGP88629.1 trypsin-like serine protease [Fodinibius halophilus]